MGDAERRSSGRQARRRVDQRILGGGVEGGSRLIEDDDRSIFEKCSGDGEPLLLPVAQRGASLAGASLNRHAAQHRVVVTVPESDVLEPHSDAFAWRLEDLVGGIQHVDDALDGRFGALQVAMRAH